ncbi:Hypothetical protein SMAX5B_008103 [Scophthalmus maximus]|uniref:Uncharacterized protein n=1 Tax=Scophthalmus maximus TaxID=52904 RepID=A0A2U9CUX8_SCOMX|nr:Hypothetical protein SMAX5B_008103 [Scophthalmus maximus]
MEASDARVLVFIVTLVLQQQQQHHSDERPHDFPCRHHELNSFISIRRLIGVTLFPTVHICMNEMQTMTDMREKQLRNNSVLARQERYESGRNDLHGFGCGGNPRTPENRENP